MLGGEQQNSLSDECRLVGHLFQDSRHMLVGVEAVTLGSLPFAARTGTRTAPICTFVLLFLHDFITFAPNNPTSGRATFRSLMLSQPFLLG